GPRGIAVDDQGARVYVALSGSGSVAVINSHNWQVEKLIQVQQRPEKLLWVPETKTLFVSMQDVRQIAVIDANNQIVNRFNLTASEPTSMALDSARKRLYVAVRYAVLALNLDSGVEMFRFPAPGGTD